MGNETDNAVIAKATEQQLIEDATRRAAAEPLPGPLSQAFLSDAIDCGHGLFVRRIVASDWIVLKWLDSPLYKMTLEVQKDEAIREDINYEESEGYEMVWQFTHTPKQNRELKARGREVYRETAFEEFGDIYNIQTLSECIKAIGKQVVSSFETKVSFEESESKKK